MVKIQKQDKPILLFNDECGVCRYIARWVRKSAQGASLETSVIVQAIGDDPEALRSLDPDLDIWDAYATIHLLMPDGSMKLGGEAVAEVLRRLPNTKWFAWSFAVSIFGIRPFQMMLNMGYAILADVRPLFGCESCGQPSFWLRPIARMSKWAKTRFSGGQRPSPSPHFTALPAGKREPTHAIARRPEPGPSSLN